MISHGLRPHQIRQLKLSNDPQFAVKVRDIVGLHVNPTIADAVLDRLVHGANRIELKGESMRKLKAARARLDEPANK
jgi:hypothetical protein